MLKKLLIVCLFSLIAACSSLNTIAAKKTAEINIQLALTYLQQQNIAASKQKLILAQQQAPEDAVVWYSSGYFYERTGDNFAAQNAYLHAIHLAPNLGETHNNYGAFLCRQGQYQTAISQFLLAVADSNYLHVADAYQNAGFCALQIPDENLAARYFQLARLRSGEKA